MPTPTSEASAVPAEPEEPAVPEEPEKEKVVVRIRTKQLKASVKRPGGDGPSEEGRKKKAKKRKVIESDDSFEEESLPDEDDYASLEEDESQLPVCFTGSSLSSFRMAKQRPDKKFIKSSML